MTAAPPMPVFAGKVALVTGAGRGIGRAIAVKLAAEGAAVVVNDLDPAATEETVALLTGAGGSAAACSGSVTDLQFGELFVSTALDCFGRVDFVVNNAGYTWDGVIQNMSDEQWRDILEVHLTAPFRILRAASSYVRDAAKREIALGQEVYRKVVNVSSISGIGGNAGQANYASAKAGLIGLTRSMAKEWARYRVNVNCVAFGIIRTRLTSPRSNGETIEIQGKRIGIGLGADLSSYESQIPLGRAGTPEEAAGAVYLLCRPESNYITGQTLVCSGGMVI